MGVYCVCDADMRMRGAVELWAARAQRLQRDTDVAAAANHWQYTSGSWGWQRYVKAYRIMYWYDENLRVALFSDIPNKVSFLIIPI